MFHNDCLSVLSDYLTTKEKRSLSKVDKKIRRYLEKYCCWKYIDDNCLHRINPLTVSIISEKLRDEDLQRIAGICTSLTMLYMSWSNITDKGLEYISTLSNLFTLDIRGCEYITDKGLKYISLLTKLTIWDA